MTYDTEVHINKDARGEFVFSWLRETGVEPIRVQAWRSHVEGNWGVDWQNAESIKAEFRRRRSEWILQAEARATKDETGTRVFSAE